MGGYAVGVALRRIYGESCGEGARGRAEISQASTALIIPGSQLCRCTEASCERSCETGDVESRMRLLGRDGLEIGRRCIAQPVSALAPALRKKGDHPCRASDHWWCADLLQASARWFLGEIMRRRTPKMHRPALFLSWRTGSKQPNPGYSSLIIWT